MLGYNEYYDDLLLEAKSPEEIKKILEYQFVQGKGVPQEVLDSIFALDPTKKKSYTKWALIQYVKSPEDVTESIKSGLLTRIFKYFQSRADSGLNLASIEDFNKAVEMLPDEDPILTKEGNGGPEDNYDIVFKSKEWIIAVPHTYEADKKLGRGCRWCTAGAFGDNDHYWKQYSQYGPLWVNFDLRKPEVAPKDNKEYPYTRYQFLFEYQNWHGELMDSNDERINFENIDMPENVIEFYGEQNERYKDIIENGPISDEELWQDYNEERMNHGHLVIEVDGDYLSLLPEEEQEPVFNENCNYYLYDEEDVSDPISYENFDPDDFFVQKFDGYPIAFLRPIGYNEHECLVAVYDNASRYRSFRIYDNITIYGQVGDYVYFVDDAVLYLYDSQECVVNENISEKFFDVKDVFFPEIDSTHIEGYNNTIWIEVCGENDFHSLYAFDYYYQNIECIVKRDKPIDDYYTINFDEKGRAYIQGKYSKHWLNTPEEDQEQSFDVIGEVYDNICVICMGIDNNGKELFNFYDLQNKTTLLNEPFYGYKFYKYLVASLNLGDSSILYDLKKNAFASPKCDNISDFDFNKTLLLFNPDGTDSGIYFYINSEKGVNYSGLKCRKIVKYLGNSSFIVNVDETEMLKVINVLDKTITLPDNVIRYGTFEKNECPILSHIYIQLEGNKICLINYKTDKIIAENVTCTLMPKILTTIDGGIALLIKFEDGTYNIVLNDKLVLNNGAKDFPCYKYEMCTRTNIYCFKDKANKIFFIDIVNSKIMPYNGINIPVEGITLVKEGIYEVFYRQGEASYTSSFVYDVEDDEILRVTPNDDKTLNYVNSIIHPQAVQIAEQFKRIYKKIIDIDRNL